MTTPSHPLSQNALKGAIYGFAAMGLYSLSDITIKFLGSDYSPVQILFFSGMAGFPLVIAQMMVSASGQSLRPVLPRWTAARMAIIVVNGLLVSYAFANLPLSQAYAIFFLMPLFICILAALFLGEPIDLPRGAAVLAGLIGVAIVLRPGQMPLTLAHLAALFGASFGALYYIILRKTGGAETMSVIMLYPMLAQTAVVALLLPWVYVPMPATHLGLTGLMALESFLGSLLIIAAYRNAPAVVVAPMQYGQIIWATLFGVLFFNEPMDTPTIAGIAVIIAAGLFIMLYSHHRQATAQS
jgi:S-adenosylmethionine uptake transporter